MLFYLIRHGEPNYELDTLTPRGWEQAEALSRRLALHGLDRIYASPLGRAQDTARPTAKLLGLPIEIEPWSSEELAWADFAVLDENGKHQWAFFCQNTRIRNEKTRNLTMDNWYTAEPYAHIHGKEGFERIRLPAYTWAVFKCVGPMPGAIQAMWERIYREWLPVSGYELIPDYEIENYLPGDPSSPDYVSEICIPVRKSR